MATRPDALIKDDLWSRGRTAGPDTAFDDIFENELADTYGYAHYVKLQTAFEDARNNETTLQIYQAALNALIQFQVPANAKNSGAMQVADWDTLKQLIDATDISLPGNVDITDGDYLLRKRKPDYGTIVDVEQKRSKRQLHRQQQKAYSRILRSVAALINHVLNIYRVGTTNGATPQQQFSVGALNKAGFLKTLGGYPAGICHKIMHGSLTAKLNLILRG